jgi:hypothetical protein
MSDSLKDLRKVVVVVTEGLDDRVMTDLGKSPGVPGVRKSCGTLR